MAHVFISYSKRHRALTERIAALLERQEIVAADERRERLTVWWDTSLLSGEAFHREITRQIDLARAVVVLWTEGAVASDWVYAEAQRGASQRKLVPLRERSLDTNKIPLPYSAMHTDTADDDLAIVASVLKRVGGSPCEDVAALGEEQRWLLDPKTEPPLARTAKVSPALLLHAKHRVVPFVDVDNRRQDLIDWTLGRGMHQPQATAGRVIHGPGGLGKTRLLIEIIRDLTTEGWLAGFLNRGTLGHATRGPQLERLVRTGRDARGLLLTVDYAEGRAEEVIALAELMSEREHGGGGPARLVLLSRGAGDWWRELSGRNPSVAVLFGIGEEAMDTTRLADVPAGEMRLRLWRDAAIALKSHLVSAGHSEVIARDPAAPADAALAARLSALQRHPDYARPLAIQMEALLWLRGVSPEPGERGIAPMLERMVALERAHWEKVTHGVSEAALNRGVAQITAVQGVEERERAITLLQMDAYFGMRSGEAAAAIVGEISKLYGEEVAAERGSAIRSKERLAPLEPDLIGEHHVATVADAELIDGCLRWIDTEPAEAQQKRRRDLLTVLQRATLPEHGAVAAGRACGLLDGLINTRLSLLAAEMVAVMIETPGALARILDERLNAMHEAALVAIDAALPEQSLTLMELSLRVAERRANLARDSAASTDNTADAAPPDAGQKVLSRLADCLNTLGVRLSNLGRHEEALGATQEAVGIYRRLAQTRPDAFLPDLAMGLTNLGIRFFYLHRHKEALAPSQEAVDIYQRLAEARSDVFLPPLARSLGNLGNRLFSLDARNEALAATQRAVDIFRRLAETQPNIFLADLATSLSNLGSDLSNLDRREEARVATQEAVDILRGFAQARPDTFIPDLARGLGMLGRILLAAERGREAAAVWREGLAIIASFAERQPHAFGDLARQLSKDYFGACEKAAVEPDEALLERIAQALGEQANH